MAFHDVVWPMNLSIGADIGPEREVEIVTSRGGIEKRNLPKANSRRRYVVSVPADDHASQDVLTQFWEGRRGMHKSFPIEDPLDHKSCAANATIAATDQTIGTGDDSTTTFQLVKVYEPSGPDPYTRTITKPITATVIVALDGTPQGAGWSVGRLTGIVTFVTPPTAGQVVTAGFHFHTPVRFDGRGLPATVIVGDGDDDDGDAVVEYSDVTLVEVLGE